MKKYLLSFIALALVSIAKADNIISLPYVSGQPGDEVEIVVSLDNTDNVSGLQMILPLDKYVKYVDGSCVLNSERSDGHSSYANYKDNKLSVIITNMSEKVIKGNNGELFRFKVSLGYEPLSCSLTPTVTMSTGDGQRITSGINSGSLKILCAKANLVCPNFERVALKNNFDSSFPHRRSFYIQNKGNVAMSISDISFDSDEYSIEGTYSSSISPGNQKVLTMVYSPKNAGDFENNVSVTSNAINSVTKGVIKAKPYAKNEMSFQITSTSDGSVNKINLSLYNTNEIYGLQCEIRLPEGIEYVDGSVKLNESRGNGLSITAYQDGNIVKVLAYSTDKKHFSDYSGQLIELQVAKKTINSDNDSRCRLQNVVLTDENGNNVYCNSGSYSTQGYFQASSPTISVVRSSEVDEFSITNGCQMPFTVSNTQNGTVLQIDNVAFLSEGYSIEESLPIVVNYGEQKQITVLYNAESACEFSTSMLIYSNDIANRMKSVPVGGKIYEPNSISLSGIYSLSTGCNIDVGLENYSNIVAMQMDITVPEGCSIKDTKVYPTERLTGLTPSLMKVSDTKYRLLVYSLCNEIISGNTGNIFNFVVQGDNMSGKTVSISNITISGKNGINYSRQSSVEYDICLLGDANGDGVVDKLDVDITQNYILGKNPEEFEFQTADVNNDGKISVVDLSLIIEMLVK